MRMDTEPANAKFGVDAFSMDGRVPLSAAYLDGGCKPVTLSPYIGFDIGLRFVAEILASNVIRNMQAEAVTTSVTHMQAQLAETDTMNGTAIRMLLLIHVSNTWGSTVQNWGQRKRRLHIVGRLLVAFCSIQRWAAVG